MVHIQVAYEVFCILGPIPCRIAGAVGFGLQSLGSRV